MSFMFIDLDLGMLKPSSSLINSGDIEVSYSFAGLSSDVVAFNLYGWCYNSNQGEGINWDESFHHELLCHQRHGPQPCPRPTFSVPPCGWPGRSWDVPEKSDKKGVSFSVKLPARGAA